ncbi:MAG: D-cysteine desulfhydrase family protein [Bacteroidota bacterium]
MYDLDNYYPLGYFPTPLEKLERVSKLFDGHEIFIKRDDNTGLATGGNKTRKLEYLIWDALQKGCDTIISAGAQQSNHARQTAAAAAKAGMQCHLMIGGEEPEVYNGNLLLDRMFGANIHFTGERRKGEDIPELTETLKSQGKKPYIIPYGGSNRIGAMGYTRAMRELKEQIDEMNLQIDYIFVSSSSGCTQAGMLLGRELFNVASEVIGISVDKDEIHGRSLEIYIAELANDTADLLGKANEFVVTEVTLDREYDRPGYAVITENERHALKLLGENEGILLDPVYTARAFYGMLDYLRDGRLRNNTNVLFWHTGGTAANYFFADKIFG